MKVQDCKTLSSLTAKDESLDLASQAGERQTDFTSLANSGQLVVAEWGTMLRPYPSFREKSTIIN